jgi:hypothetical protein
MNGDFRQLANVEKLGIRSPAFFCWKKRDYAFGTHSVMAREREFDGSETQ